MKGFGSWVFMFHDLVKCNKQLKINLTLNLTVVIFIKQKFLFENLTYVIIKHKYSIIIIGVIREKM